MPNDPKQPHAGPPKGEQAPEHQPASLPPEVAAQIPAGQAALSRATGQSLSQMEPRRLGGHLNTLLAELAAAVQFILQRLEQQQQQQQPPQGA
jgi:hypothetical protein